jgi:hypothetical protein
VRPADTGLHKLSCLFVGVVPEILAYSGRNESTLIARICSPNINYLCINRPSIGAYYRSAIKYKKEIIRIKNEVIT